jgi:hypothetical protein
MSECGDVAPPLKCRPQIEMLLIESEDQFEATRHKIVELQALLLEMKRQVPYPQYLEMAQAFLADIDRMEEEMRAYLLSAPPLEAVPG